MLSQQQQLQMQRQQLQQMNLDYQQPDLNLDFSQARMGRGRVRLDQTWGWRCRSCVWFGASLECMDKLDALAATILETAHALEADVAVVCDTWAARHESPRPHRWLLQSATKWNWSS